jgi:hypothetical protein
MTAHDFAVCIQNDGLGASLEIGKVYAVVDDPDAEANGFIHVIDESGEDNVHLAELFGALAA